MRLNTLLATALLSTSAMAANIDGTNLSVHMESAHFSGAGNTVAISRLPITNQDTGKVSYYDITARFSVNASGELVFDKVASMSAVSFANAKMLLAGDYKSTDGCDWRVSQPAKDGNGYLVWSIEQKNGKNYKGNKCDLIGFRVSDAPVDINNALAGKDSWCSDAARRSNMDSGLLGAQDWNTSRGGLAVVTQSGNSIGIVMAECSYEKNDAGEKIGYITDRKNINLTPKI